jgi:4-diphosphocytidyl-2-C-methyl-D-erythritol kinase
MSPITPAVCPGRAPAKINLALQVVGQRDDGYHLIESLVVFTRFGDRVTVGRAEADQFFVTGPYAQAVPVDAGNLVLRARDALRKALPEDAGFPVSIALEKNLPPASGIGGGSSDAAATLKGLARLWGVEDDALLAKLALPLGADVPMCLSPQPALVSGVGEKIERLPDFSPLFIVLVNPGVEVSTPAVFSRLKAKNNAGLKRTFPVGCEASEVRPPLRFTEPVLGPAKGRTLGQTTSPPLDGGEEAPAARPDTFPLPHESGGEVAAKRTEWGISETSPVDDRQALYAWLSDMRNDLQAPALELAPIIGEVLEALRSTPARFVRMSGSGATCFGLYDSIGEAEAAAADVRRARPEWFAVATETFAASGKDHAGN